MNKRLSAVAAACCVLQILTATTQARTPQKANQHVAWLVVQCQLGDIVTVNGQQTRTHGTIRHFTLTMPGRSARCVVSVESTSTDETRTLATDVEIGQTVYCGFVATTEPPILNIQEINARDEAHYRERLELELRRLQGHKVVLYNIYTTVHNSFDMDIARRGSAIDTTASLAATLGVAGQSGRIQSDLKRMRRERAAVESLLQESLSLPVPVDKPYRIEDTMSVKMLQRLRSVEEIDTTILNEALTKLIPRMQHQIAVRHAAVRAAETLARSIPATASDLRAIAFAELKLLQSELAAAKEAYLAARRAGLDKFVVDQVANPMEPANPAESANPADASATMPGS